MEIKEINIKLNAIQEMMIQFMGLPKISYQGNFGEWLDEWLTNYKKPNVKPSSFCSINICVKNHIPTDVKQLALAALTAAKIQTVLAPISSRMRKYTYDVYHESLEKAYKLHYLATDIANELEPVKHTRKKGTPSSSEEITELFAKLRNNISLANIYRFYVMTGCRRGEALALEWNDIDFTKKTIHIHGTKTEGSNRIIPLFSCVENLLLKLPRNSKKIFSYYNGYLTRTFHELCPNHKLHDLRHTFATQCLELNIPLKVVQQWLGHSNYQTTANIYTHVLSDFEKENAQKINFIF